MWINYIGMFIVDKEPKKWIKIKKRGNIWPGKLASTQLVYNNGNIYLFGGIDNDGTTNGFYFYNIKTKKWSEIDNWNKPNKCCGHQMKYYSNHLILFGGVGNIAYYNDIYIYSINECWWQKIDCKNKPKKRCYHNICINNEYLIISGGISKNKKGTFILNDMYIININDILNYNSPKWIKLNTYFDRLHGHSLFSYKHKLICFGGLNSKNILKNNLTTYIDGNNFVERYSNINSKNSIPNVIIDIITQYSNVFYQYYGTYSSNKINSIAYHNGSIISFNKKLHIYICIY